MLKGNLVVGKNQSVVVHAASLQELVKLAESKGTGALTLRVDLNDSELNLDLLLNPSESQGLSHPSSLHPPQ